MIPMLLLIASFLTPSRRRRAPKEPASNAKYNEEKYHQEQQLYWGLRAQVLPTVPFGAF